MTQMTPQEIIDIAIKREAEAAAFYRKVAGMQNNPEVRDLFLKYAIEEDKHKELLENLDISAPGKIEVKKVANLKIGDHMKEVEAHEEMDYKQALILGMQKEKKAYLLYMSLVASTEDPAIQNLFNKLAMEEAKHKLYFETQYDDYVLEES
jgi:rubrerythrin